MALGPSRLSAISSVFVQCSWKGSDHEIQLGQIQPGHDTIDDRAIKHCPGATTDLHLISKARSCPSDQILHTLPPSKLHFCLQCHLNTNRATRDHARFFYADSKPMSLERSNPEILLHVSWPCCICLRALTRVKAWIFPSSLNPCPALPCFTSSSSLLDFICLTSGLF